MNQLKPQTCNFNSFSRMASYEENVIYLNELIISPRIFSRWASSLKVETFLRLTGLKFINVRNHLVFYKDIVSDFSAWLYYFPYIELNGKKIQGDDSIIKEICEKFEIKIDDSLTTEQRLLSHSIQVMLTSHTIFLLKWLRGENSEKFLKNCVLHDPPNAFSRVVRNFFAPPKRALPYAKNDVSLTN